MKFFESNVRHDVLEASNTSGRGRLTHMRPELPLKLEYRWYHAADRDHALKEAFDALRWAVLNNHTQAILDANKSS